MVYYKIYDRQTLELADAGIVKDYNIDFDYMTNNASTLYITQESKGHKGDLVAISQNAELIALGAITAIDNGDKRISFKHPKSLFNDRVINVFKFTQLLNKKFEAVSALRTILTLGFVTAADPHRRLPLEIRTSGTAPGAVWIDDSPSIHVVDFIDFLFDRYNIFLDFNIDFESSRIVCTITHNNTRGLVLKDNIHLSKPELDNNELPRENVAVLFRKDFGNIVETFYLLQDNTIMRAEDYHAQEAALALESRSRILPPAARYIEWDEVDAIREGYTMDELAWSEIGGQIYEHFIEQKLLKTQTMVRPSDFRYGDQITIIYKGRSYESLFTGIKFRMRDPFFTCIFGKTRIDFTDRMKIHNNRRFAKRN